MIAAVAVRVVTPAAVRLTDSLAATAENQSAIRIGCRLPMSHGRGKLLPKIGIRPLRTVKNTTRNDLDAELAAHNTNTRKN